MTRVILLASAIIFCLMGQAFCASAPLPITIHGKLAVVFTPNPASSSCDSPPGTVVSTVSITGGNGKPVVLTQSGDTTDFALSATTLPANVVVASAGITSTGSSCATLPLAPATTTDVFTVTATQ